MKYLLFVLPILAGCSSFHVKPYKDPDLVPYVLDYKDQCLEYYTGPCDIRDITVVFADLKEPVAGVCERVTHMDGYIKKTIRIDRKIWRVLGETLRHVLMAHEMGHCHLMRGHDDRYRSRINGWDLPSSIMHHRLQFSWMYEEDFDYYMMELFNGPF